jgi:hypothetical protein
MDAEAGSATRSENTSITGVKIEGAISWDQLDKALPMPLDMKDAGVALAVRSSDVVQALDQELLRVSGLTGERYRLKIDGEDIGAFTKGQLSDGINLATLPTPMMRQAADVHALTL